MVDEQTGFVTRNILCVAIKSPSRNEIAGAFQLLNKTGDQGFVDEGVVLAEEIAGHLQAQVDAIFLDQEVYGLTERLFAIAKTTMAFLFGAVGAVILLVAFYTAGGGIGCF